MIKCSKCKNKNFLIPCVCHCGAVITEYDSRGRKRHFEYHHNPIPILDHPQGINHYNWKGGRQLSNGYIMVKVKGHPSAKASNRYRVPEHRLVMEKYLGRYLTEDEIVHHIGGSATIRNNRIENLECTTRSKHASTHGRQISLETEKTKSKKENRVRLMKTVAIRKPKTVQSNDCYACGFTSSDNWYRNYDTDGNMLCKQCAIKYIYRPRQILFLGKTILLSFDPHQYYKYICSVCGEVIKGKVNPHHYFYLPCMPWACREEQCVDCHAMICLELGQVRRDTKTGRFIPP